MPYAFTVPLQIAPQALLLVWCRLCQYLVCYAHPRGAPLDDTMSCLCITSLCTGIERWSISWKVHRGAGIWPRALWFCFVFCHMFSGQPPHNNWRKGAALELGTYMASETPEPWAQWATCVWGPAMPARSSLVSLGLQWQCSQWLSSGWRFGILHCLQGSDASLIYHVVSLISTDENLFAPQGGLTDCRSSSSALVSVSEKEISLLVNFLFVVWSSHNFLLFWGFPPGLFSPLSYLWPSVIAMNYISLLVTEHETQDMCVHWQRCIQFWHVIKFQEYQEFGTGFMVQFFPIFLVQERQAAPPLTSVF